MSVRPTVSTDVGEDTPTFACLECLGVFGPRETVLIDVKPGEPLIICIDCWASAYPAEDGVLMSVLVAEQNRGADE